MFDNTLNDSFINLMDSMFEDGIEFNLICNTPELKIDDEGLFNTLVEKYPKNIALTIQGEVLNGDKSWWDDKEKEYIISLPFGEQESRFSFDGSEIIALTTLGNTPIIVRPQGQKVEAGLTPEEISDKKREEVFAKVKETLGDQPLHKLVNMTPEQKEGVTRSIKAIMKNNPHLKKGRYSDDSDGEL